MRCNHNDSVFGLSRRAFRLSLTLIVSAIPMLAGNGKSTCWAQSSLQSVAPVPLGTPGIPVGPSANPFGPAPFPIDATPFAYRSEFLPGTVIAPGTYPAPYAFPGYFAASPQPIYAVPSYPVRRPTPFESAAPFAVASPPVGFDARYSPQIVHKVVEQPAAIGNLRMIVSESFLNRLIARDETKPGEVRDFILGAQVSGRQNTITRLRLDLLPQSDKARAMLVLNGTTHSETTGVTPQAMIETAGQHEFTAHKELFFDGMKLSTRHAVIFIRAQNQTLGAKTPLSGTLFGGIADRIAFREAERRRPQSEAIARDRVAERVYPEFDDSIDQRLATANDQLERVVRKQLRLANMMPSMQQVSTTDLTLNYCLQVGSDTVTNSPVPADLLPLGTSGAQFLVHEGLVASLIARSGINGLKTTDLEARQLLAPYEVKSTDAGTDENPPPIALPGMENIVTDIEFDKDNPLTIRFERDRAVMTMRAKFKPAGQDVLPPLAVTIEYRNQLVSSKIILTPGNVQVALLNREEETTATLLAIKLVSQAIEANLTKLAFDRALPSNLWSIGGQVPQVVGLRTLDGWAMISIE